MTFKIFSDFSKFDPAATAYDANNALLLADAARLSYSDEAEARAVADRWSFGAFAFIDNPRMDTQAIVMGNDRFIVVAFRGTQPQNPLDWITDAKVLFKEKGPAGAVHRGFWTSLQSVWPAIVAKIDEFQDKGQTLWFTGHSLGAALAVLAVADLRLRARREVNGLYTFGQPRVGDDEFAKAFNADLEPRTFRFVNNNDVVTRVPLKAGYADVGRVLYFDAGGVMRSGMGWWALIVDRLKGAMGDFGKFAPDNVKDHFSDGYAELLSRNMTVQPNWG